MTVAVQPMEAAALVALVNDWGSRPIEVGHRARPSGDIEAIRAADRLHAIFGEGDPARRASLVTALLHDTGVRPTLTVRTPGWAVPSPSDALLASAALTLREHPDRIGVCQDRHCADVYVDASPAGRRRFCSLTCQNRSRVANYRARRREP